MKRIALAAVLLVVLVGPARAGYDEEWVAYKRGDYATALEELRPLAEQGHAAAQYNLGFMYANGEGVPQDYVQAHLSWNLAAAQGDEDARKNRDRVVKRMTPAQVAEAQAMA